LKTTYATIRGFEVMRALRKAQAAIFNLTQDIRGEARIVERAFGIGVSALAEAISVFSEKLNVQPA
jgi:IS6 family transposase